MSTIRHTLVVLAGGFVSCACVAAPVPTPVDVNTGAELLRVVLSLLGVVALIFVVGWLSRRAQGRIRPGGRRIRCLESMPVGVKERVMLLEVGGTQLLVGASPSGLRTLHVLATPIVDDTPPSVTPTGFRDLLAQWKKS
ncbi:MAG TPA: flagellar biosynthetic protein FliO [Luteibacter sp.]|jgi:flagellar protein FliO/FliZ|nr:flagellar biosynthetic protein FliO [Luteibacter sp.]